MFHYQYSPYLIPLGINALITAWLGFFIWGRRAIKGAKPIVALMAALFVWTSGYALEMLGSDLETKLFWAKMQYFGILTLPISWLGFALHYTNQRAWLSVRKIFLFAIIPSITLVLVATNELHHLVWSEYSLITVDNALILSLAHGPAFWVNFAYTNILLAAGVVTIIYYMSREVGASRNQIVVILIGLFAPWVGNLFSNLRIIQTPLDLTPFAFTITGVALTLTLFRYHLLDLAPVAYKTVVESMSDAIIAIDKQNNIIALNPAAERVIGLQATQAIGTSAIEAFGRRSDLVMRYSNEINVRDELTIKDGDSERHFELVIAPLKDRSEYIMGRVITLRDITKRWNAEKTLLRQNDYLQGMHRTTVDMLARRNLKVLLQLILERATILLDAPYGEIMLVEGDELAVRAFTPNQPFLEGDKARRGDAILSWRAIDSRTPVVLDDYSEWRQHRSIYDQIQVRAIMELPIVSGTKCLGVLAVSRDVKDHRFTAEQIEFGIIFAQLAAVAVDNASLFEQAENELAERKQAQAQLAIARDEALEASQLKSQLLQRVSHELRTPLGIIRGFSDLLHESAYGDLTKNQSHAVEEITESAIHLTEMVNDLLDEAQLEANAVKLRKDPFSISEVLDDIRKKTSVLALQKGLTLNSRVEPNIPDQILGDGLRLRQILLNLIGNAIKFTEQGEVNLHAYLYDESNWAIDVSDTGIGIPDKARQFIFEPFRQVDGSITRSYKGTGLGLAIVRNLVDLMNGKIALTSEVGKGSTFTVILPLETEKQP